MVGIFKEEVEAARQPSVARFSQEDLEIAFQQMKTERLRDFDYARAARDYLVGVLDSKWIHLPHGYDHFPEISPYSFDYTLVADVRPSPLDEYVLFESEEQTPSWVELEAKLYALPGTRRLPDFGFATPLFEVETPLGKYKIKLESTRS